MIRNESLTRLANHSVRIEILPLGASLHRFEVRLADGTWRNMVLGYPNLDGYRTARGKLGMSIGRYANRIAGAASTSLAASTSSTPTRVKRARAIRLAYRPLLIPSLPRAVR